jgi:hypothetical protein
MCLPFCHKWEVMEKLQEVCVFDSEISESRPVRTYLPLLMRCNKCGWIKGTRIKT